jgi:hypothetical protein
LARGCGRCCRRRPTADNQAPLPVIAKTPNEWATGDMKLPARETERPMKNQRNAGHRSGRSAAGALLEAAVTARCGGSES